MIFLLLSLAFAAPPEVVSALKAWEAAVDADKPDQISALVPEGEALTVRFFGEPARAPLVLDRAALEARLAAGEGGTLGLERLLLTPQVDTLTLREDGRYSATGKECPEVTWVFAEAGGQWRLVEIERRFYRC